VAPTQEDKARSFRAMHEGDPFVIPNPWDAGTAKILAGLRFKALATTSGGFSFSIGQPDGGAVTLDQVAGHVASIAAATDLPVSVDLENGYGPAPEDAARAITAAAAAGAVGGSIEDFDRDERRLYEREEAVERVAAAVEAARALDFPFTLTARAENHFRDNPDLDDTITRLQAYEEAGADVLYAPGLYKLEDIEAVCDAVSKPVNVLAFMQLGLSMSELAEAGAQRVSVGSGLTWTATTAVVEAAERLLEGDFSALGKPGPVKRWLAA
jgi:2-methylisocitrate lyase-like PEP mutase family enzyme